MSTYNFNDHNYDGVKDRMRSLIDQGTDKESVKNLEIMPGIDPEKILNLYKNESTFPDDLTLEMWKELYHFMEKKDKKVFGLVEGAINDSKISTDLGSQWQQYKKALKAKNFSSSSIDNIEQSSYQILQQLDKNTLNKEPVKGLVVGSVQSGKTANMIGLMSMAADYGFNFFIIFSGIIDNLRIQTENRMYKDLNLHSNLDWVKLSNPSLKSQDPVTNWRSIHLDNYSNKRYFTVSLKNKSRMDDLIRWLYSDENKLDQLKVLIIDDEADQASINTKKIEDNERTSINDAMLSLVEGVDGKKIRAVNYISYTATPYANALNESGGLFPKDFVVSLPVSEDYIGPKEIFGLYEPEQSPRLDIVRGINDRDFNQIIDVHEGVSGDIPTSLKEAITWFFLSVACYRIYGYKSPISMLIHTSHKIDYHEAIHEAIHNYLLEIKEDKESFIEKAKMIYNRETIDFPKRDFERAMPDYSALSDIKDYPPFEEVEHQLRRVLNEQGEDYVSHIPLDEDGTPRYTEGFHIVIDNSRTKASSANQQVRLVYPTQQKTTHAPMFIVIGGNTLSRGLTLEGLTTSYFLRTTTQADTLFQMGRWFGYRKGYELLPRIWLDFNARSRFEYVSQINEELIDTIEEMSIIKQAPKELGIKVKNSPDNAFLRLTSSNKMQEARALEWDFSNINKQTIIFSNDVKKLRENLSLTIEFLTNIDKELMTVDKLVFLWKGVPYNQVKEFLSKFNFSERDTFFRNMDMFLEWFDKTQDDDTKDKYEEKYSNWNVILATKESPGKDEVKPKYELNGHMFYPVSRTRHNTIDSESIDTVSIGALRSPTHMIADVDAHDFKGSPSQKDVRNIRKDAGLSMVPQLILYIIDKDSTKATEKSKRMDLNFDEDVVGMNLYIPGSTTKNNLASYLSVTPKLDEDVDDLADFIDIEED